MAVSRVCRKPLNAQPVSAFGSHISASLIDANPEPEASYCMQANRLSQLGLPGPCKRENDRCHTLSLFHPNFLYESITLRSVGPIAALFRLLHTSTWPDWSWFGRFEKVICTTTGGKPAKISARWKRMCGEANFGKNIPGPSGKSSVQAVVGLDL